jgi:Kef-type K+ transport system membrane component KefB
MSSVAPRSPFRRAIDGLSLALVSAVAYVAMPKNPSQHGDAALVVSLGLLLLAGILTSKVIEVIKVPHLTGYLVAGIVAGPHVLHLIDHESVQRVQPVNTLALALIALAGGMEIEIATIKRMLKSLATAMVAQGLAVLVVVSGVFFVAAPKLIPFTRSLTTAGLIGVALLWGVLAVSRSPSATLAVISETHAKGPLTSYALGFVMSSDVVVVLMLAGVLAISRTLIDPSATLSLAAFSTLAHEIIGSVAIGTTLGLVLAAYVKFIGRELLLVLVALGFGATETLHYLAFDPLLTFLIAGFVVRNLSAQGEKLLRAAEGTAAVVYVVFFASAGAHLDLPLLRELAVVAVLLAAARAAVTFAAAKLASRLANDPPPIRTWGWTPLISQAGLTLGLSAVIAREFPALGDGFRALAIATVAINEFVGPILFKVALDRSGETRAPDRLAESAGTRDEVD